MAEQLAVLLLIVAPWVVLRPVAVKGPSMEPTYEPGARLMMTKHYWLFGPVRKGDEVLFKDPEGSGKYLVKRVFAVENEEIPNHLKPFQGAGYLEHFTYRVPSGSAYVLGDNLGNSIDSRSFGSVSLKDVKAKSVHFPGLVKGTTFWLTVGSTGVLIGVLAATMRAHHM